MSPRPPETTSAAFVRGAALAAQIRGNAIAELAHSVAEEDAAVAAGAEPETWKPDWNFKRWVLDRLSAAQSTDDEEDWNP